MGIRTVISVNDSVYLHWQSQLLQYSHAKVGQPGALTRLVATNDRNHIRSIDGYESIPTSLFSPHPVTGDDYAPYNKPGSLNEWIFGANLDGETLLVIDPDCVFIHPVTTEVEAGRPIGEEVGYMDPAGPEGSLVIKRHCRKNHEKVQPLGVPILISPADLRLLAPRWYELTCQIRDDAPSRAAVNWVGEMWGYTIAAAELGLVHQLGRHQCTQFDQELDRPILHYSYDTENAAKNWRWSKREYQAWAPLPPAPDDVPPVGRFLHSLINEVGRMFQHRRLS